MFIVNKLLDCGETILEHNLEGYSKLGYVKYFKWTEVFEQGRSYIALPNERLDRGLVCRKTVDNT